MHTHTHKTHAREQTTEEEKRMTDTLGSPKEAHWMHRVPILNLFYDLLSSEPPGALYLEKLLNVFSLVGALLLAVVLSVPASFSVEELESANERIKMAMERDECWYKESSDRDRFGDKMSDRLLYYYNLGVTFLSCSLFMTILVYAFFSTRDFVKKHSEFVAWWKYVRYCVLVSFMFLIMGVSWTYLSMIVLIDMKFPRGCMKIPSEDDMNYEKGSININGGFAQIHFFLFQITMLYVSLIATACILSAGSWNASRAKTDV